MISKRLLAYPIIFSLCFSNIAFAARPHLSLEDDQQSPTLASFKPIIKGSYSQDDWYLNIDGSISGGQGQRIEKHNQPKLLRRDCPPVASWLLNIFF